MCDPASLLRKPGMKAESCLEASFELLLLLSGSDGAQMDTPLYLAVLSVAALS